MNEDKLTQPQRIRLEAFAQVNAARPTADTDTKIRIADKVAKFIATGEGATS